MVGRTAYLRMPLALLAFFMLATGVAWAQTASQEVLDAHTELSYSAYCCRAGSMDSPQKLAHTFTAENSGQITKAQARLAAYESRYSGTYAQGNLVMEITTVPTPDQPATALASTTIVGGRNIQSDSDGSLVTGFFSNPATVKAGQQYALRIGAEPGGSGYSWMVPYGDPYPNGELRGAGSDTTWTNFTEHLDGVFAIYVVPDTTPPDTTITSGTSGVVKDTSGGFSFSSSEGDSTFECSLDDAAFSVCNSPMNYTDLADGNHTFQVRAIDAANNVDPSPAQVSWRVDTSAPTISLTSPTNGTTYKIKSTVNAAYSCADETGGSGLKSCAGTVANGSPIDTSTTGTKTFTVTSEDNVGNASSVTHTYYVTKSGKTPKPGGGKK